MIRKRGFTLIELLIVVAIIAVLISILAPALQLAKEHATAAACVGNQSILVGGWIMYHQENKGHIVGGSSYRSARDRWVEEPKQTPFYAGDPPQAPYNDYVGSGGVTDEYRYNGYRAGKLWKYVKSIEAYHCPGDTRIYDNPAPYDVHQSYSASGTMKGECVGGRFGNNAAEKITAFKFPETKMVFIEEAIRNQWTNAGSWVLQCNPVPNPNTTRWIDPMGYFHNERSTLSFADGHAIVKAWMDERTVKINNDGVAWPNPGIQPDNPDLQWLAQAYTLGIK